MLPVLHCSFFFLFFFFLFVYLQLTFLTEGKLGEKGTTNISKKNGKINSKINHFPRPRFLKVFVDFWLPFWINFDPTWNLLGYICVELWFKPPSFCLNVGSNSYSGTFFFQNPSFEHPNLQEILIVACAPTKRKFSQKPFSAGPGRIYCRRQLRSAPGLRRRPRAC